MPSLVYLRNKSNDRIYVYSNVRSGTKDGKPVYSRRCIGHLDEKTGEIVPNNTRGSSPTATLKYSGLSDAIIQLSERVGLTHTLKVTFGSMWRDILTCAMYGLTGNTDLSSIESWCMRFETPSDRILTQKDIEELLSDIDEDGMNAFQRIWRKKVKDRNIMHISASPAASYDRHSFTSMISADTDSVMTVDMDICYGIDTQLPISYNLLPSKVLDLEDIIGSEDRYRWINPTDILYVLNKEYCEGNNVNVMVVSDRRFTVELPKDHHMFKTVTDELHDDILTYADYKTSTGGSNFVNTHVIDVSGTPCYAHMYYSAEEAEKEIGSFLTLIEKCRMELVTNHLVNAHTEIYGKFFDMKGPDMGVELNSNSIMEHTKRAGTTIILSDVIVDPILALDYMSLNVFAERTFNDLQNGSDHLKLKLYLRHNLESRYFIQFITLILRSVIRKCLIDNNLRRDYTVEDVVREINNIALVNMSDRKVPIRTELNFRQRLFLEALGTDTDE